MSNIYTFIGMYWHRNCPESFYQMWSTRPGQSFTINYVQLKAILHALEVALEAKSQASFATDLSSWLAGYEAGLEASSVSFSSPVDGGSEDSAATDPRTQTRPVSSSGRNHNA